MISSDNLAETNKKKIDVYDYKYSGNTAMVNITPIENWTVKKIVHWWQKDYDSKWKKETVTNGTEVKLKGIDEFDIVMHNEQYNLDLTLYLALEER